MTEYFDIRCGDDLDPFARDVPPLETFAQDIYHLLITNALTLIRDPDWGKGLQSYLGKPLPTTLAADIVAVVRNDDRASDAECTITKDPREEESYRLDLKVEADSGFLDMALKLTPDGLVRVS